ncbi:aldo/keto reductase [Spiroplasma tabanidicola]|uniref:Aldo/keto reductase n=1 Tax=Spiroplasma tabanidicola TaxID=324079 RepID=A0A6I6C717_9MOLU|nr:aldo/keto reductase [Spiroplasma tabanidicola]QGS52000.1 aldo/keto reductase [Spiroplasma tabanidicola]
MSILKKDIKFNNGLNIPQMGLGTYQLKEKDEIFEAVQAAIEAGYRHIDTAMIYKNQKAVGEAIKSTRVKREDIFITSKIWNSSHAYEDTKKEIDVILNELGIEYIDLLLIHWPTPKRLECWKALEEAVIEGKVKSIGVSNFLVEHLEELLKVAKIKPVINQFELHPALTCKELVDYCKKHEIVVESWGTLIRGKCFEVEQLNQLAKKYNKSEAQICLKWAELNDYVIIPKSSKKQRVIENANIDDFTLTKEDLDLIATIKEQRDGPDPSNFNF